MIKSQHEHEQQWWKARQELIEKQKARTEGQKKLDEVLKLVGGATSEGATNTSPEELAKELETFDMKVYRAQTQMMREFTAKLKSLGVPFFGTKAELIKLAKEGAADTPPQGVKDGKVIIDEVELIQLQKKMITILEDLCAE
ncbi:hypothetical protein B0O99DRAFT_629756 [Bisporella sp. PMI_857]|nr:hypothetical protein B0O99DRAFT_629756 [Bisporella sp. PMI_857]